MNENKKDVLREAVGCAESASRCFLLPKCECCGYFFFSTHTRRIAKIIAIAEVKRVICEIRLES
jgi:hypothetical protein